MATEDELRERVDELETAVEDLQAELRSLREANASSGLSRRGALGLGAVGLGGLLGAGTTVSAATGSVGTPTNPVDVHAVDVRSSALETDEATIGAVVNDLEVTGQVTVGDGVEASYTTRPQRGAPTTDELAVGERMTYTSDGSDGHSAGDLVSALNEGGTIVSQVIVEASGDGAEMPDGPSGEWTLAHDEQWTRSIPDSPYWNYGLIDDEEHTPDDDGSWSADHVYVQDEQLVWGVENDGDETTDALEGTLNSASNGAAAHHPEEGIPIDPAAGAGGVYVEASIAFLNHDQEGLLPAWWCMPASQSWPGELDVVEHETSGAWTDGEDPERSWHSTYHWATTGTCGDFDNHAFDAHPYEAASNLTDGFHTYGLAWYAESSTDSDTMLEWFFDGRSVREVTFGDATQAAIDTLYSDGCRPHGMQLSCHVNRGSVTGADMTEQWHLENACDWVRVWHLD